MTTCINHSSLFRKSIALFRNFVPFSKYYFITFPQMFKGPFSENNRFVKQNNTHVPPHPKRTTPEGGIDFVQDILFLIYHKIFKNHVNINSNLQKGKNTIVKMSRWNLIYIHISVFRDFTFGILILTRKFQPWSFVIDFLQVLDSMHRYTTSPLSKHSF